MNVPKKSFADKKIRELAHCTVDMRGVNKGSKHATGVIRFNQYNVIRDRTYQKLQVTGDKGKVVVVKETRFGLSDAELLEQYEIKRKNFLMSVIHKAGLKTKPEEKVEVKEEEEVEEDLQKHKQRQKEEEYNRTRCLITNKPTIYKEIKQKYMDTGKIITREGIQIEYNVGHRESIRLQYMLQKMLKDEGV